MRLKRGRGAKGLGEKWQHRELSIEMGILVNECFNSVLAFQQTITKGKKKSNEDCGGRRFFNVHRARPSPATRGRRGEIANYINITRQPAQPLVSYAQLTFQLASREVTPSAAARGCTPSDTRRSGRSRALTASDKAVRGQRGDFGNAWLAPNSW